MTRPESAGVDRLDIDVRFLLANERTLLAWLRTALTLMAGGVALAQLAHDSPSLQVVGLSLICLGSAGLMTAGVVILAAVLVTIYLLR